VLSTSLLSRNDYSLLSTTLGLSSATMSKIILRISPTIVDIRMRGLFEALVERDDTRINRLCNAFIKHMDEAEPMLFTHEEVEDVKEKILYIQLLSFMSLHDVAIDTAADIQNMCRSISHARMGVISHLSAIWRVPHLDQEFAMGPIDDLPALVKHQIAECLKSAYLLV